MPFDGFTTAAVVSQLDRELCGGKIERVNAPTADETVLLIRTADRRSVRLCLSASSNIPKVNLTGIVKENPAAASALCMHLRKHLNGARIVSVTQPDFERVVKITVDTTDEMGFPQTEHIYSEIMGKYSNVILTNGEGKIINCVKPVDFTTSSKRQILPGMKYEAPPPQDKLIPSGVTKDVFISLCEAHADADCDTFFLKHFRGFSPLLSRETAFRAGCSGKAVSGHASALYAAFCDIVAAAAEACFRPCIVYNGKDPVDYCAFDIRHYGQSANVKYFDNISACIDAFYSERENNERIKQRGADVLRIITSAEAHIRKKILNQTSDLSACEEAEKFRLYGDLLTANLYRIKKGASEAELENYYSDSGETVPIPLDFRLSPSQNAQKYYKKYNKLKTAKTELTKRIADSYAQLEYIKTVSDAFLRSETEEDLQQIRAELYETGYASKMKTAQKIKTVKHKPMHFVTSGGYDVYVGRNNIQNDRLTMKEASRFDWFFHVKGAPGSHVIMACGMTEPDVKDFTEAAIIAAYYSSKRDGENVEVDYTQVKNIKKPSGSAPGFVIYSSNFSATVTPDKTLCESLRADK